MDETKLTVTIEGKEYTYEKGTSYHRIAEDFKNSKDHDIVLVTVDGRLRELHHTLKKDCVLDFVTTADKIGDNAYRRSMLLMMLKAIYHTAGHENVEHVRVQFAVGNGLYCTISGNVEPDAAFLKKVEEKMPWRKRTSRRMKPLPCSDSTA